MNDICICTYKFFTEVIHFCLIWPKVSIMSQNLCLARFENVFDLSKMI